MTKLEILKREVDISGLEIEIIAAPQGAVTFDLLALIRRPGSKFIMEVVFVDSINNKIVNRY